ncbi:MAG: DUF11 domain-containing protein [Planctomycetaceae bacterium]|jgi:uncharacterized repeat protein (TIGR01451 family)|nr:DUF11 domain-containing protein [Planctomycetaceae bacterium]
MRKKFFKKIILLTGFVGLTLGLEACRQPAIYKDSRYDLPTGVKYDDYAWQESWKTPKMYAGTTMPEHWQNTPRAGSYYAGNTPKYAPASRSETTASQYFSNATASGKTNIQSVSYQASASQLPMTQQTTQSGAAQIQPAVSKDASSGVIPPRDGIRGKMPLETMPIPAANSQVFSPDFSINENAGRPSSIIYRGQTPESQNEKSADERDGFDEIDFNNETKPATPSTTSTETPNESETQSAEESASTDKTQNQEEETQKKNNNDGDAKAKEQISVPTQPAQPVKKAIDFSIKPRNKEAIVIDPTLKRQGQNIPNHRQAIQAVPHPDGYYWGKLSNVSPQEEYLADGGDNWASASVRSNGELHGVDPEDTVVQYDALDRRTFIEKSNSVYIYSPRFGSVRQIDGLDVNEQWLGYATIDAQTKLRAFSEKMKIGKTRQNSSPIYTRSNVVLRETDAGANLGVLNTHRSPMIYAGQDVTHSLSQLLTHKTFSSTELAFLAQGRLAAVAWGGADNIEVYTDERMAQAMIGLKTPEAILLKDDANATVPKLKLFKIADKDAAQRGEIVTFMIRFENIGSEQVGNINIVDSLTPRLEYVEGSASASVPTEFFTEQNQSGSLTLRWEISKPLNVGDFGVLRFQCRVQ